MKKCDENQLLFIQENENLVQNPPTKKQDMKNKLWMKFFHELFMNMFHFLG
jgi:hypothetical protein